MKKVIETERLILREVTPADLEGFYELDTNPIVHRYLGNQMVQSIDESAEIIDYIMSQYAATGIGRWSVLLKSTQEFIGWSGIKFMQEDVNDHVDFYDLGYRFLPRYWGQGYASESANAFLDYGFDELEIDDIYAFAHVGNKRSQNVLTKVGFQQRNHFEFYQEEHIWYVQHRADRK
jgi:RimJ/RimL family protein N-acetyltransferase